MRLEVTPGVPAGRQGPGVCAFSRIFTRSSRTRQGLRQPGQLCGLKGKNADTGYQRDEHQHRHQHYDVQKHIVRRRHVRLRNTAGMPTRTGERRRTRRATRSPRGR
jgi:hypothetical protein